MRKNADPKRRAAPIAGTAQASPRVIALIDEIRRLVAERRRLEAHTSATALEACRAEIACLQRRLADAVRRDLIESGA